MNPFTLIPPPTPRTWADMFLGQRDAVRAAGPDLRRVLLPADPAAAAEAEGNARRCSPPLKRGDRVVTGGGILGTVQRVPMVQDKDGKQVPSQEIEVEIAPNLRVTVLRDTITTVIKPVAANDTKPVKEKAS